MRRLRESLTGPAGASGCPGAVAASRIRYTTGVHFDPEDPPLLFANELKPGTAVLYEGKAYLVDSTVTSGTAQRRRSFTIKMHDLRTGQNFEKSFGESDKFEEPDVQRREVELSYQKGRDYVFMDQIDFQEYVIPGTRLEKERYFLREGEKYRLLIIDAEPCALELPTAFELSVIETASPANASQGSSQLKEAKLDGGLVVKVPPFIKVGDRLRIATASLEYLGKA
jgi:elongation factor P